MKDYNYETYDEIEETEDDRKEYRRKRRKRNESIAYVVTGVILISLIAGGILGVSKIIKTYQEMKHAKELAEQLEQLSQEEEPPSVEAPASSDITDTATGDEPKDYLEQLVEGAIADMPLEDRVAGLFMVTPEALTGKDTVLIAGETTKEKLGQYAVGGLIYFAQNIQDKDQLTEMLSNVKSMSKYRLFLGVDEEGGRVARVAASGIDVPQMESMSLIGETGDAAAAYDAGATIGSYLAELGFNLDFAPVGDVGEEGSVIGDRAFSEDGEVAAQMTASAVEGLQSAGISACVKHFPGLGGMKEDTHEGSVISDKTKDELSQKELLPFQAGIEAGTDFIMISHLSLPEITGSNAPASMSEEVMMNLLREEMGYEGIIITDSFSMSAITDYYASDEAAVKAIQAGADMILMPENFEEAYQGVLKAVEEGVITVERIDESLKRIYRVKYAGEVE